MILGYIYLAIALCCFIKAIGLCVPRHGYYVRQQGVAETWLLFGMAMTGTAVLILVLANCVWC